MLVGRGAITKHISAVAASQNEVFHLDPPLYYAPTLKQQQQQQPDSNRKQALPNVPFYGRPPPAPMFLPPDVQEDKAPSKTETAMTMPTEGEDAYKEAVASLRLSEKVHILGFTREARYITHCLAGTEDVPPPQMLTHSRKIMDQWGKEGQKITLRGQQGLEIAQHILMPKYVGRPKGSRRSSHPRDRLKHIDNLIISTTDAAILPSLLQIRDSINQDTTICLINAGLGVVEHVNQEIFQDPETRPLFVLGHSDHAIKRVQGLENEPYSIHLGRQGRLILSAPPYSTEATASHEVKTWRRIAHNARVQHVVKLLSAAPGLHAVGVPMHRYLRQKLPSMIFSSVADSISVALGFPYARLCDDRHARWLWSTLWKETIHIIASFPELQQHPEILDYFTGHNFLTEAQRYLRVQDGSSKWIAMVRDGRRLPLEYLNGYFVRRAEELGVSCTTHKMVMSMVKSKVAARRQELKIAIPLYYSPYLMDDDHIRNEETGPPIRVVYIDK
ncbi:hypothetical protein BJ170DRAFT_636118 [Xylariales sp. AK1849]|nr:hypothetical protein BJ170DRAFT_636118 [Xylariales sp. AK1849]